MSRLIISILVVLACSSIGRGEVPCVRAFTHTPIHEQIFLPKSLVQPRRTVADLNIASVVGDTNLIARLFSDPSKERAGLTGWPCISEVPLEGLAVHCAGDLLKDRNVRELMSCTVVVPRPFWLGFEAAPESRERYVFTLADRAGGKFTIDLRPGGRAIVFFPDGTYRCIIDKGYPCVPAPQPDAAPNAAPPHR